MDISKIIDELILKEREKMVHFAILYSETNDSSNRDSYMKHKYTFNVLKDFLESNKINFENISKELLNFNLLKQKLAEKSKENVEEKSEDKLIEKSTSQKPKETKTPRTRRKKEEN